MERNPAGQDVVFFQTFHPKVFTVASRRPWCGLFNLSYLHWFLEWGKQSHGVCVCVCRKPTMLIDPLLRKRRTKLKGCYQHSFSPAEIPSLAWPTCFSCRMSKEFWSAPSYSEACTIGEVLLPMEGKPNTSAPKSKTESLMKRKIQVPTLVEHRWIPLVSVVLETSCSGIHVRQRRVFSFPLSSGRNPGSKAFSPKNLFSASVQAAWSYLSHRNPALKWLTQKCLKN